MPYYLKAVIIIAAAAAVSFFAAELLIPEKDAVTAQNSADGEQPEARPDSAAGLDGDIPVVVIEHPAAPPKDAPAIDAKTAKAAKTELPDTKTSKALDAKTAAAPPQKAAPPVQNADAPKPQPAAAQAPAQKTTASPYRIEKTALCSAIKDREPQGITDKFSKDAPSVYYFTSIVGARDTTAVIHRWYQNGKLIQTSILPVKSSYWRTHSRRNLLAHNGDVTGQWRVDVVESGTNKVLESASFTVE